MSKTIGINELSAVIAQEFGISKQEAKECWSSLHKSIGKALASGEQVSVRGFGQFYLHSSDRPTINPKTHESCGVQTVSSPRFKPYNAMIKVFKS